MTSLQSSKITILDYFNEQVQIQQVMTAILQTGTDKHWLVERGGHGFGGFNPRKAKDFLINKFKCRGFNFCRFEWFTPFHCLIIDLKDDIWNTFVLLLNDRQFNWSGTNKQGETILLNFLVNYVMTERTDARLSQIVSWTNDDGLNGVGTGFSNLECVLFLAIRKMFSKTVEALLKRPGVCLEPHLGTVMNVGKNRVLVKVGDVELPDPKYDLDGSQTIIVQKLWHSVMSAADCRRTETQTILYSAFSQPEMRLPLELIAIVANYVVKCNNIFLFSGKNHK